MLIFDSWLKLYSMQSSILLAETPALSSFFFRPTHMEVLKFASMCNNRERNSKYGNQFLPRRGRTDFAGINLCAIQIANLEWTSRMDVIARR